jgi:hypothetical protein
VLWQQFERVSVRWADDREVAAIERGDPDCALSFGHRDHGRVRHCHESRETPTNAGGLVSQCVADLLQVEVRDMQDPFLSLANRIPSVHAAYQRVLRAS